MSYVKRKGDELVVRYSCLTGRAVWIYWSPSRRAEQKAYERARKHEIERVEGWAATAARRKENIAALLRECTADLPALGDLPPEKRSAARRLLALSKAPLPCHTEFYDHIMEERRRREQDREIRRRMRERDREREKLR